jgi:membrane protease YdiL (CAAX protease family)
VGLSAALLLAPAYALLVRPALVRADVHDRTEALLGLTLLWLLAGALLLVIRRGEHSPWRSVGIRPTPLRWILAALTVGVALALLVPLLSVVAARLLPATGDGGIVAVTTSLPWTVILLAVVTAAVTEELLFRAYPVERLLAGTGSRAVAVALPLASFTVTHAQGWAVAHVVGVVMPLGLALSALYLWRRNLLVVVLAHLVTDLPLLVLATTAG